MARTTAREQAVELARQLREYTELHDQAARTAVKLIETTVEELRDRLVEASGDDMLRTQGAVRQFAKLHKELTTKPPTIQPE
jgi:exopolyphosphatase/pppGpp-phosphohydrolase